MDRAAARRPGVARRMGIATCGAALLLLLSGCGFRPLYGAASSEEGGTSVSGELGAIFVPPIPDRTGQLLRQALQQRFEGAGSAASAKRYEMQVNFSIVGEGIGIRQDNTTTRLRLVGTADWTLRDLSPQRAALASGTARALDGLNILNQQFFAADLETETVQRRLAENVAGQIAQQVATYLRRQGRAAAAPPPAAI